MTVPNKVLLIGYLTEGTFSHLVNLAYENSYSIEVLDLNYLNNIKSFKITLEDPIFSIDFGDKVYKVEKGSVFYRGFYRSGFDNELVAKNFFYELESFLQIASTSATLKVFNPPRSLACNSNKYLHLRKLKLSKFRVPETIVTNMPDRISTYIAPNHTWVNKGVSGTRTIVNSVGGYECFRLGMLNNCPSLFQRRVFGYDVRVHFIQTAYVALKISSNKVDYRYAKRQGGSLIVEEIELPQSIYFKCIDYMQKNDSNFIGFDFKVDEYGKWWILEANPMPGFEFFDQFCGNRIGIKLLEVLMLANSIINKPSMAGNDVYISKERIPMIDLG